MQPEDEQQFFNRLIHDLREPLRAINTFSELLKVNLDGQLNADAEHSLSEILKGVARAGTLVDALSRYTLALSEESDGALSTPLDLALRVVLTNHQGEIQANEATVLHGPLPQVGVGLNPLVWLLENLVRNALKFRRDDPPVIHISADREEDGKWRIRVEDNGMGLEKAELTKVLQPFTRIHGRKYPGSGLGLFTCRTIVDRHEGRIWAEARQPHGLAICFTLPAGDE